MEIVPNYVPAYDENTLNAMLNDALGSCPSPARAATLAYCKELVSECEIPLEDLEALAIAYHAGYCTAMKEARLQLFKQCVEEEKKNRII